MHSHRLIWHILFWLAYVVLEYLANIYHIQPGNQGEFVKSILVNLPFIILPSYFMALFVVPRLIKKNRTLSAVLSVMVVCLFVFYGRVFWFIQMTHFDWAVFSDPPMGKLWKNSIRDFSVIALATCIYLLADWREKQKRTEELIRANAEAELRLLKGQLQPHFLFNTLNNIYSLSLVKSDLTADAILKLTELLEYLVYEASRDRVLLKTELSLIDNYLDLEALRHESALQVKKDVDIEADDIEIAPLIILPFVENCFKHGGKGDDGVFRIRFDLKASTSELLLEVENTVPTEAKSNGDKGGVGLFNVRKRLDLVYPDYDLSLERAADRFVVYLKIRFK